MDSVLTSYDIEKYVAGCTASSDMRVVWDDDPKACPRTDGKTMFLPRINFYTTNKDADKLKTWVKHETSHKKWSDFSALDEVKPVGAYMYVWNLLEDHRVDFLNDTTYEGDMSLSKRNFTHWAEFVNEHASAADDMFKTVVAALFSWDVCVREEVWGSMDEVRAAYAELLSEQGAAYLHKLLKGDYADVLKNIRQLEDAADGTRATGALARRILKEVFDAEETTSPPPTGGEEEEGASDGEGEGKGEEEEGSGEKEGVSKKLQELDCGGKLLSPYSEHKSHGGVNARNYECGTEKVYTPTPTDEIRVWDYDSTKKPVWAGYMEEGSYKKDITDSLVGGVGFANKVRTRLQVISRDRWEYGKKRGKLNNSSLYRVGMTDAKGYNERVFKKQLHNDTLDTAITVLIDASGSMHGDKYTNAMAAAALLNESLGSVLHLPVEILAFTELGPVHTIFVLKNFGSVVGKMEFVKRAAITGNYLADNVDGESIIFAYNRLIQRKEKRRILMVLSDGSPCGGHSKGKVKSHTHDVIEMVEKSPVELLGVGIMYDAVSDYYSKWATIKSAKDIEHELFRIIDRVVFR